MSWSPDFCLTDMERAHLLSILSAVDANRTRDSHSAPPLLAPLPPAELIDAMGTLGGPLAAVDLRSSLSSPGPGPAIAMAPPPAPPAPPQNSSLPHAGGLGSAPRFFPGEELHLAEGRRLRQWIEGAEAMEPTPGRALRDVDGCWLETSRPGTEPLRRDILQSLCTTQDRLGRLDGRVASLWALGHFSPEIRALRSFSEIGPLRRHSCGITRFAALEMTEAVDTAIDPAAPALHPWRRSLERWCSSPLASSVQERVLDVESLTTLSVALPLTQRCPHDASFFASLDDLVDVRGLREHIRANRGQLAGLLPTLVGTSRRAHGSSFFLRPELTLQISLLNRPFASTEALLAAIERLPEQMVRADARALREFLLAILRRVERGPTNHFATLEANVTLPYASYFADTVPLLQACGLRLQENRLLRRVIQQEDGPSFPSVESLLGKLRVLAPQFTLQLLQPHRVVQFVTIATPRGASVRTLSKPLPPTSVHVTFGARDPISDVGAAASRNG